MMIDMTKRGDMSAQEAMAGQRHDHHERPTCAEASAKTGKGCARTPVRRYCSEYVRTKETAARACPTPTGTATR